MVKKNIKEDGEAFSSTTPANQTGAGINNYDPMLQKPKKKKLRDILTRKAPV